MAVFDEADRGITPYGNNSERKAAKQIISELNITEFENNARQRTIIQQTYGKVTVRVDLQGTYTRNNVTYANVQVQIGNRSIAGAEFRTQVMYCNRINERLLESLRQEKFLTLDE